MKELCITVKFVRVCVLSLWLKLTPKRKKIENGINSRLSASWTHQFLNNWVAVTFF